MYTVQRQSSSSWSTRATTSSTSYTGSDSSGDPNWRVNVTASDGSCAVPGAYTTFDPAPAPNTGFRDCGANTAVAGGDNNGFEGNASSACTDNSSFATDTNSGTSTSTSCGSSSKDNHDFYNYGFAIPAGATIHGIEVRLDAWIDSTSSSTRRMCVEVSWNGGQSWTAVKQTSNLSSTQSSRILGSASDTWGRTWSAADFSNANFRVRVTNVANSISRDFRLDWVPVR
jgi:hypothetical protein